MHRNRSVNVHDFSMVPRADIPRSGFRIESSYKTTFDAGYLYPVYVEEVLPGDTFNLKATMFARLATQIVPIIDNLYLESFFFFVPNRLTWTNWTRFMGQQENPGDSIDFTVPQVVSASGGFAARSIYDYFGLPTAPQTLAGNTVSVSALPFRAYNLIWNRWFRDENLQTQVVVKNGDAADLYTDYNLMRRGKRHDYFTSCLPWAQKGAPVTLPLSGQAPIKGLGWNTGATTGVYSTVTVRETGQVPPATTSYPFYARLDAAAPNILVAQMSSSGASVASPAIYADLSQATATTINQIRQAFQIQRLLERDARGGTRYQEILKSHFGVLGSDSRLQRPEYLGGGRSPIVIQQIVQTSASGQTGATTPLGNLSGVATTVAHDHGFHQSFTEHGVIIGLISVRADLNYQQGINRFWSRKTRYDYYWPVFSHLGEQAVLNKEIYSIGTNTAQDDLVFGYQERWAEYRYKPSLITSYLRSYDALSLDVWHLAQNFTSLPTLNSTFIQDTPPVDRIVATTTQTGQEFVLDCLFVNKCARPLPMYSVPGLMDHF